MNLEQQLAAFYRRKDKRFVEKLWDLVENSDLDDVIRWGRDGTYIVIPNTNTFEERVLKVYFKTKVYSSFVRQLHMYGFRKRTQDVELIAAGACNFEHKLFVRGKFDQLLRIQRTQPKNRKERALAFSTLPFVGRSQRVFQRPTGTLVSQPAHCLTARFNYHVTPTVSLPGILATQLYNKPSTQSVVRSTLTALPANQDDDNKENCLTKSSKLPPLLVLAEICSAILTKGHPKNDEERRQCIQVANESIQRQYRCEQFLYSRRASLKTPGVITTSVNSTMSLPFIPRATQVKLAQLMTHQSDIYRRPHGKQIPQERERPMTAPCTTMQQTTTKPTAITAAQSSQCFQSTACLNNDQEDENPLAIDID